MGEVEQDAHSDTDPAPSADQRRRESERLDSLLASELSKMSGDLKTVIEQHRADYSAELGLLKQKLETTHADVESLKSVRAAPADFIQVTDTLDKRTIDREERRETREFRRRTIIATIIGGSLVAILAGGYSGLKSSLKGAAASAATSAAAAAAKNAVTSEMNTQIAELEDRIPELVGGQLGGMLATIQEELSFLALTRVAQDVADKDSFSIRNVIRCWRA